MIWRWLFPTTDVKIATRELAGALFAPPVVHDKRGSPWVEPPKFTKEMEDWCKANLKRRYSLTREYVYDSARETKGPNGENYVVLDGFDTFTVRFRSAQDAVLFKTFWL